MGITQSESKIAKEWNAVDQVKQTPLVKQAAPVNQTSNAKDETKKTDEELIGEKIKEAMSNGEIQQQLFQGFGEVVDSLNKGGRSSSLLSAASRETPTNEVSREASQTKPVTSAVEQTALEKRDDPEKKEEPKKEKPKQEVKKEDEKEDEEEDEKEDEEEGNENLSIFTKEDKQELKKE